MRIWTTLALLAAIVGGIAFSAQAYTCNTTCNSYGNQTTCNRTCF
jgi:hypothetical protein